MRTLAEIENATEALSVAEKQELLLFLATRLRGEHQQLPTPRQFTREQIGQWIAEDEEDLRKFRQNA
jgi:hypothetical protein